MYSLDALAAALLLTGNGRRLAFVGVAKNCGKTTTLNLLLRAASVAGLRPGLVSIGIDGEARDALLGTSKPTIAVDAGHWVVTARAAADQGSARLEYVAPLGWETPMGEVYLAEVMAPGNVILAGIRHREDLRVAQEALWAHGVAHTFIDGAYGRVVAAHAELSDAVVLSTGAVVGASIETIVQRTAWLMDRLSLALVEAPWQKALLEDALGQGRALLGGPELASRTLGAKSALMGLARLSAPLDAAILAVAIPGLVSDRVAEELLRLGPMRPRAAEDQPRPVLLVGDGTSLHLEERLFRRLERVWEVRALHARPVVAVGLNPTSVQGHVVDEQALCEALQVRYPGVVVFNPMRVG